MTGYLIVFLVLILPVAEGLFNDNLEYHVLEIEKEDIGNLLLVKIHISDELTFLLLVLYGQNRDEPKFYNNLMVKLSEKKNFCLVICGDWNLVQNFEEDTYSFIRENNTKAKLKVKEMQSILELEDV